MAGGTQKEAPQYETLSASAQTFLSNRGFSQSFIAGLQMMLREAGSTHARSSVTYSPNEREFMDSPGRPVTVTPQMPSELSSCVRQATYQGREIMMPDIGPYAPSTQYTPETFRAFASPEGQRFMQRYYLTGWLRKVGGEWVISPPAPLAQVVPRRAG
jgi:hypothetical protein